MDMKSNVLDEVRFMIAALSEPVSVSEIDEGWTAESKAANKEFFMRLKSMLESGHPLPLMSISRSLDHWGVIGGPLLEKAAQISNLLRLNI
jgi:hypothetical protein